MLARGNSLFQDPAAAGRVTGSLGSPLWLSGGLTGSDLRSGPGLALSWSGRAVVTSWNSPSSSPLVKVDTSAPTPLFTYHHLKTHDLLLGSPSWPAPLFYVRAGVCPPDCRSPGPSVGHAEALTVEERRDSTALHTHVYFPACCSLRISFQPQDNCLPFSTSLFVSRCQPAGKMASDQNKRSFPLVKQHVI